MRLIYYSNNNNCLRSLWLKRGPPFVQSDAARGYSAVGGGAALLLMLLLSLTVGPAFVWAGGGHLSESHCRCYCHSVTTDHCCCRERERCRVWERCFDSVSIISATAAATFAWACMLVVLILATVVLCFGVLPALICSTLFTYPYDDD